MCASHVSDPFMARPGKALERSCSNAAWLRAEMAQLEKRQSQFLSRGEHGYCGEKPTVSHIPQRYHDSKPNRDYLEKEMEEERSRDGIASLMKAADRGRIRGEEWQFVGERNTFPLRGFTGSSLQDLHSLYKIICSAYHLMIIKRLKTTLRWVHNTDHTKIKKDYTADCYY